MNDNLQSDQSIIWIIHVCAFFTKIFTVLQNLFLQKKLNHQKKPLSGIRKNSRTFFHYTIASVSTIRFWVNIIRLIKLVLFFFQTLLKSIFEKNEVVFKKFLMLFFNYTKNQTRSRDLQIRK
jgi:hypothetical protein